MLLIMALALADAELPWPRISQHWSHVARHGIVRRIGAKAAACRTMICPSVVCGGGRSFPLAGGSSAKSMYSLPLILSTSFLRSSGRPGPMGAGVIGYLSQLTPCVHLLPCPCCWPHCPCCLSCWLLHC